MGINSKGARTGVRGREWGIMRIAVVHGYYLGDSGSGIYVRNLVHGLLAEGHEVTLVCQERHPERYGFTNSDMCHLIRPELTGNLLVYVDGPFEGFAPSEITTFQDASEVQLADYIASNTLALRTAFAEWQPDLVLAQHAIMQPYLVREALGDSAPCVVTTHGSELSFTLKRAPHLAHFALDGLAHASAVAAVSAASARDLTAWTAVLGTDISAKTHVLTPGIDTALFTPSPSRAEAIAQLRSRVTLPDGFDLSPHDDIIAFAGRVAWFKGIHHAVAALSLVSAVRPHAKLLIAGDGPARDAVQRLAETLSAGDIESAHRLAADEMPQGAVDARTAASFGPAVPDEMSAAGPARIACLGHLDAEGVAAMFAASDIALTPSLIPEAAALVASEALSSGALPIVAYHSGLETLADIMTDELGEPRMRALSPRPDFTTALAETIARHLERYPTAEPNFRQRLHRIAENRLPSWRAVAREYVELGAGVPH
jgi:glycosyltransferase involved in cell wall biosynthesis